MAGKNIGARDANGNFVQAVRSFRDGKTTVLTISTTATSFTPTKPILRIVAQEASACLNIGGTAATTDSVLPAGVVEYAVSDNVALSCISATGGDGQLFICEVGS